jgi:hypothetical protein
VKYVTPEGFSVPRQDRAAKSEGRNPRAEGRPNSEIRRCRFPLNRGNGVMHRLSSALAIQLAARFPLTPALSPRERIPRRDSRFAPLNRPLSGLRHPLPLRGGEGKGEGAVLIASRFRGRETGGSAGNSFVAGGCFRLVGNDFRSFGEGQGEGEFDDHRHVYASSRARAAISDFGLRFSFGFRPSGFGFQQSPPP